jgi:hypothetical protein
MAANAAFRKSKMCMDPARSNTDIAVEPSAATDDFTAAAPRSSRPLKPHNTATPFAYSVVLYVLISKFDENEG